MKSFKIPEINFEEGKVSSKEIKSDVEIKISSAKTKEQLKYFCKKE